MSRLILLLGAWSVLASGPAFAGDTYCIYVRSSVTGEWKAHSCRFFNSFEECQMAAERIHGKCGVPK